jgi:hypothetical protein
VTFDNNPVVATAVFLQETLSGTKDTGFEQQYRANEDKLQSFGLNGVWDVNDRFKISIDGHISKAESDPDAPNGTSSTSVSIGAPIISSHSVDYSGKIPIQSVTINDALPRGNGNGVLDLGDLGSQVARTSAQRQEQEIKEFRADASYEFDDSGSRFDFGVRLPHSKMKQTSINTQQDLGSWGISNPRDVQQYAGSLVKQFCLSCRFDTFDAQAERHGPDRLPRRRDRPLQRPVAALCGPRATRSASPARTTTASTRRSGPSTAS